MKHLLLSFAFLFGATLALAQWRPGGGGDTAAALSSEEIRLVEAFRANPEPFRRVLFGHTAEGNDGPSGGVYGARDFIDVTVSGGKIAFYGRRQDYLPASIRLRRGEVGYLVFGRDNRAVETRVKVAYCEDGLHFDVKDPYVATSVTPRGFVVIPESPAWRSGTPIPWTGHLDDPRSLSKAENVTFRIRYVGG